MKAKIKGLTLTQHKQELRKWKSKEVVDRFNLVGSSLPTIMQTEHKCAINQLQNS
jgi:hypothetical protein